MLKCCVVCAAEFAMTNKRQTVCRKQECESANRNRRAREWRAKNREWVKRRSREYNIKHRTENIIRTKKWNETHRQWIKLRNKLYRYEQSTLANAMRAILNGGDNRL